MDRLTNTLKRSGVRRGVNFLLKRSSGSFWMACTDVTLTSSNPQPVLTDNAATRDDEVSDAYANLDPPSFLYSQIFGTVLTCAC
ncbi:hypothetical protein PEL8287_01461 [Roseovarius litorisediminis]|uniref:Uncharacterized protein n=1 Tax=Roseovarius litorisediminis TaxID=1312363 RepID=A0A1Y5S708_9RHOB|nr:hypothetical protein [Roseovarius litorisediminis]SLN31260.1 hypothetical protein PEL8287_01461 [Roseovarius litorisediminis]